MDSTISSALKKVHEAEVSDTSVAKWLADVTIELEQIEGYESWKGRREISLSYRTMKFPMQ
eukprot:1219940-Amphidinium_carterae.1